MNRCKECVFFEKGEKNEHFGECKNFKKLDYGTSFSKETDWHEVEITDDMLLYMDAEWYSAGIEVGENFGCIHFEKNISRELAEFRDIDLKKLKEFQNEDVKRMKENV